MRFIPQQPGVPLTVTVEGVPTLVTSGMLVNPLSALLEALPPSVTHFGPTGRIRVPSSLSRVPCTISGQPGHVYGNVWFTPTPAELEAVSDMMHEIEYATSEQFDSMPEIGEELFPTPAFANATGLIGAGSWTIGGDMAAADGNSLPMVFGATKTIVEGVYEAVIEIAANPHNNDLTISVGGLNNKMTDILGGDPPYVGTGIKTITDILVRDVTEQTISINETNGFPVTITSFSLKRIS